MAVPAGVGASRRAPGDHDRKAGPYLRYFATHRPIDDHGVLPTVLVVFEDELAAARFVLVVSRELSRAGLEPPLLVSDTASVDRLGPPGPAWRRAGEWTPVMPCRRPDVLT